MNMFYMKKCQNLNKMLLDGCSLSLEFFSYIAHFNFLFWSNDTIFSNLTENSRRL